MNFGHKVLIAYIAGALGIIFMVVLSLNINFEMAEDNYYAKEEKMEQYLEGKRNSSGLDGGVVQLSLDQNFVIVNINRSLDSLKLKGELYMLSLIHILVPTFLVKSNIPTIASVKPYTPLELQGRDLYIREGCYNCHSQMIRPFRDEVARYGEFSKGGEFVYDHPFQWGSKRTGPDLARIGLSLIHI